MVNRILVALTLAAASFPLLAACHASEKGSGTPAGIYCQAKVAQEQICYGYSNLDAEQKTAVSDACTGSLNGTIGSSCPSGQMGCCTTSTAGYDVSECYYVGTASAYESACKLQNGKWSAGANGTGPGGSDAGARQDGGSSPFVSATDAAAYGPQGSCSAGQTECPAGCVTESSDVNNCGSCGYACPAGPAGTAPSCSDGKCTYACSDPSQTLCDSSEGQQQGACVNLQDDMDNCGQCDNPCYGGEGVNASCQGGVCQMSCSGGEVLCSGYCLDVTSDNNNCGGCGTVCQAGTVCSNGSCGCDDGQTLCNGTCTTLSDDPNNCGQCGMACGFGSSCQNSACVEICPNEWPCQGTGGVGIYCCGEGCGPSNSCQ